MNYYDNQLVIDRFQNLFDASGRYLRIGTYEELLTSS